MKRYVAFLMAAILSAQTALGSAGLHALADDGFSAQRWRPLGGACAGHCGCCFVDFAFQPNCEANQRRYAEFTTRHQCAICHYFSLAATDAPKNLQPVYVLRMTLHDEEAVNLISPEVGRQHLPRGPPNYNSVCSILCFLDVSNQQVS